MASIDLLQRPQKYGPTIFDANDVLKAVTTEVLYCYSKVRINFALLWTRKLRNEVQNDLPKSAQ